MTDHPPPDLPPDLRAALDLWEPLAARAWAHHQQAGRGMLIVTRAQLEAARAAAGAFDVEPTWFPITHMPPKDDYHAVVRDHDPDHEIVLLVGESDADEQLYVIRADPTRARPTPPTCTTP